MYLCFLIGPSKESLSLLCKAFLRPLLTYVSPGWFPFLRATNIIKLVRPHRAASRAITACLSSSPTPLLLSKASLPPLRVTLIHFTLLSYERALRHPTSFLISGLARLGVKPRLCRSSWRAFASTHPIMLPLHLLGRLSLLALLFLLEICLRLSWSPPSPLHALTLISLFLAKMRFSFTIDSLPLMIWYSRLTALFLSFLAKTAQAYLPTALSVTSKPLFLFSRPSLFKFFR